MQNTSWLAGTQWYVTAENLLAYLTDPALGEATPVVDQTLWSITTAEGGSFHGTSRTLLWIRTRDGSFRQVGSTSNTLDGTIAEGGEITIVFTPDDPDQAQTTGYGQLRMVDGEWRMEMQMATGTQAIALHWAYMTPWTHGEPPAGVPERALDGSLRSEEWRWLRGSTWQGADEELFPDGGTFTIDSYRSGYYWGAGTTKDGSPVRMGGSVTPEGTLYLLFSIAGAAAAARRGVVAPASGGYRMTWSQPAGGPPMGAAAQSGGVSG